MRKIAKVAVFLGFFLLSQLSFSQAWQETVTFTTYYPSPIGLYNRLATQTLGVGDNNLSLAIDVVDAPDPALNPGDAWINRRLVIGNVDQDSGDIVNADDSAIYPATHATLAGEPVPGSLTVADRVGIGIREPEANLEVNNASLFSSEYSNPTTTIDWTNGNKQTITLSGSATLTLNAPAGKAGNFVLRIRKSGSGDYTVTWNNGGTGTVKWKDNTPPTLTPDDNAEDIVAFYYNGTDFYGSAITNFE